MKAIAVLLVVLAGSVLVVTDEDWGAESSCVGVVIDSGAYHSDLVIGGSPIQHTTIREQRDMRSHVTLARTVGYWSGRSYYRPIK